MKSNYPLIAGLLAIILLAYQPAIAQERKVEPIIINATSNTILRSFVDINGGKRVTHAISVGSAAQVHYTYDADNGKLILLWQGGFLDATPMWHDRGDGSSKPLGKAIQVGDAIPELQKLATSQTPFKKDTTGSGFKPKGYTLDKSGQPTFKYTTYGLLVKDATRVVEGGIHRVIELQGTPDHLYICIAKSVSINETGPGSYTIKDQGFKIQIDQPDLAKPVVRTLGDSKELLLPVTNKISYSILLN